MAEDELREIRARVDIVDLVSQRVSLKRRGKAYTGLCPFHDDKNPSFQVTPDTGRYRCWSCGEYGDVFTWVMKTQNVDFGEALRILAKDAGVTLSNRASGPNQAERESRANAMETALAVFVQTLAKSSQAREYCAGRGLTEEVLKAWEIGHSPERGELTMELKKRGFSLQECRSLFLVDEDDRGGYYDRFRGRLMFPIRDERGDLVAFGGRLLGKGEPKYINSSETPLYHKSKVLYGLWRAREALRKSRRAVLVEGYLDVIACHSAGVDTAVASCGTALAEDQCRLLKRWADEVVILYDADAAGIKAAKRAIGLLTAVELKVRVACMSEGDDPDTLLRGKGAKAVQAAVENALSPMAFEFEMLVKSGNPEDEAFWPQAVNLLVSAPNSMEFEKYLMKLTPLYPGLRDPIAAQRALRKEVAQVKRSQTPGREFVRRSTPVRQGTPAVALQGDERTILCAAMHPHLQPKVWPHLANPDLFTVGELREAAAALTAAFPDAPKLPPSAWISDLPPNVQATLDRMTDSFWFDASSVAEVDDAISKLLTKADHRSNTRPASDDADDQAKMAYLQRLKKQKGGQ